MVGLHRVDDHRAIIHRPPCDLIEILGPGLGVPKPDGKATKVMKLRLQFPDGVNGCASPVLPRCRSVDLRPFNMEK